MNVRINLSKGKIVLRAKDDTYLAVRSFLSSHDSNANSKYEMQADERETHERKLLNSIRTSLSKLKSELPRYRMSDTLTDGYDSFEISFELSDRTDFTRVKDVERMVEEYLYRSIVADWWQTNYPELSASYLSNVSVSLDGIRRLLSLSNPNDENLIRYKCIYSCGYRNVLLYKESLLNEIHTELLKLSRSRTNETGIPDIHLQTNELEDGLSPWLADGPLLLCLH